MSKFLSQRRKKRKFYGNRFTNNQRVNVKELEVVQSTLSGSVDGLSLDGKELKGSKGMFGFVPKASINCPRREA